MAVQPRTYQDVLADLADAYTSLNKALRAEESAAGDKRIRRNIKQIRETIARYEREKLSYDPETGEFRGTHRIRYGRPC